MSLNECNYSLLTFLHSLQGDEEKSQGLTPMPMMDRDKKDELPHLEVLSTKNVL